MFESRRHELDDSAMLILQSTMFNALCENGKAEAANYPFCTIEPNVGIVAVPDPRLQVGQLAV